MGSVSQSASLCGGINSLAKLCSKVGNPICVDKFTASSERVSFARALVEIVVAKEVRKYIEVALPFGGSYQQAIYYENLPKFCSNCMVIGHSDNSCKVLENMKAKRAAETQNPLRTVTDNGLVLQQHSTEAGKAADID